MNKPNTLKDLDIADEIMKVPMTPKLHQHFKSGIDELLEIPVEREYGSTFAESFPNLYKTLDNTGIPKNIEEVSKSMGGYLPDLVQKIVDQKGIAGYFELFSQNNGSPLTKELLDKYAQQFAEQEENIVVNKPLGEIGEITFNQAINSGLKFYRVLKPQIDKGLEITGLDAKTCGNLISFVFMYNAICKGHMALINKYSPAKANYDKLSPSDS